MEAKIRVLDEIIDLNVGGRMYSSLSSTLGKYPESLLGAMMNGKQEVRKDSNGRIFIDRDGELFRYILNYLRCGEIKLPELVEEREQLNIEAEYYQIQPLIDLLNAESSGVQTRAEDTDRTKTPESKAVVEHHWLTVQWECRSAFQGHVRVSGSARALSAFIEDQNKGVYIEPENPHSMYMEGECVFSTRTRSFLRSPELLFIILKEIGYRVEDDHDNLEYCEFSDLGECKYPGKLWRFSKLSVH